MTVRRSILLARLTHLGRILDELERLRAMPSSARGEDAVANLALERGRQHLMATGVGEVEQLLAVALDQRHAVQPAGRSLPQAASRLPSGANTTTAFSVSVLA